MATLDLGFAFAIMLAIWNFEPGGGPILIDLIEPQAQRVHFVRLEPDAHGFLILSRQEGRWIQTGEIGYDRARRGVYHFGGRGVSKPLDLAAMFPAFADVTDPARPDVAFHAELDGQAGDFRQVRSGNVITLLESRASAIYILHAGE